MRGPEIGKAAIGAEIRPDLADEAERTRARGHVQGARPMHVAPLRLEFAVAVEHLHAVVLAIGDIDPAVGIAVDVVRQIELALADAAAAPGHQVFSVRRVLVHLGVAVAVGHVDLALGRQRGVGAAAERLPAHERRRLAGHAEGHQHAAVERAFPHAMRAVVGAEDRVVRRHVHAVRAREHAFAPRAQEIAGAVEHDHRMFAAVEHVDVVVAVHPDGADLVERPSVREPAPALLDAIPIFAGAKNDGHVASPDQLWRLSRHQCRG